MRQNLKSLYQYSLLRTIRIAVGLLIGTTTFWTSSASASTYDVWTCRAPDGAAAVVRDATGGWKAEQFGVSPYGGNRVEDSCGSGGNLSAENAAQFTQPAAAAVGWHFMAPDGTAIVKYVISLKGRVRGVTTPDNHFGDVSVIRDESSDPSYDLRIRGLQTPGPFAPQNLTWTGPSSKGVLVFAACSGFSGSSWNCPVQGDGGVASFDIDRAVFSLDDGNAPVVTAVSGDAVTGDLWAGTAGISVSATDAGGGVYRLGVEVDGQVRSWKNLAGAPCAAWPGTERTFLSPKPCPSSVGGVQQISTADLPDGVHTVRILVEDAAGNQTTAYGPVTKTLRRSADGTTTAGDGKGGTGGSVTDPGPLNGTPAVSEARIRARWTGRESATKSIRFNQRPKLDGQVTTPNGQPIKGAFVRVTIRRDARNSPAFDRDSLKTDSRGRFRWTLPKGVSSRSIKLAYHQRVNDTKPVASTTLRLRVAAGLRLALSRRTVRRGQTVELTGTVLGRPVPGGGKVIELQARNAGGRWITFRTVRSRRSGTFKASYRFRNAGPARFQMRARARKSGDYPYATGSSPVRRISVR